MTAYHIRQFGTVEHPHTADPCSHVVVTMMDGRRIAMHPICNFKVAVEEAIRCAETMRHWTAQLELQCWPLADLCRSLGIAPAALAPGITLDDVVTTLTAALRETDDYLVRREATEQLSKLGVTR